MLVDVNAACMVSRSVSTVFVALSYVWGDAQTTKLGSKNYELLQQPGALRGEGVVIPDTIRDAM